MSMKRLILINAIVWAGVILIMAWLFKDHPNYMYGFGVIVVAATLMNGFILSASRTKDTKRCIK